ncbi:hypothetical protein AUC61_19105 [Pseudomonas sp. S25]|uniref:Type I secretion C-terminal target domain (VC_A0849 subclass) n=1 Tax=Pseudomonas maioricensis TaxID=1766623 RepID=A0ABS9ZMX2_9PSED|nr:retention module-containing protein [Pseudomonas sp. S25]MCI8211642.1 hypothetical protein [Pseudomonas sp. S25]
MGGFIGTVRQVAGDVFAVAGDGTRRILIDGDRLFAGEQVQTGGSGAVAVNLNGGGELTLGRGSSLQLTPQLLNHQAGHVDTADELTPTLAQSAVQPTQTVLPEQVISADAQLQAPEAADAGPEVADGSSLGGGHSALLLAEVGGEVTPEIGFPTQGLSAAPEFPEGRIEGLGDASSRSGNVYEPPVFIVPPADPEPPTDPEPPVEPPVDHAVELCGGQLTFNENDLSCGPVTQAGVFTVSAVDGLQSLVVGGLAVISAGIVAGFPLTMQTPLGNTFSVIGYDPATGEVSYSYTLQGAADHPAGDGTNVTGESFSVVAHDSDGDSANSTLDINIVDDVPEAHCIEVTLSADPGCPGSPLNSAGGSLLQGGTFGADGGFVHSISIDGTTYSYDPHTGLCVSSCAGAGVFDPATHSLTVTSEGGGTLVVNMLNGDFSYTPSANPGCEPLTENIQYVISDNDGDLAGSTLQINVPAIQPPEGPTAVADNVITNILAPCINIPGALLLANDVPGDGGPLTASPTVFHTGWQAKGEGFSNDCPKVIDFSGKRDNSGNQLKNLERSDFTNTGAMTAMVAITGYLGAFSGSGANAQDLYSFSLVAGESVTVDLKSLGDQIGVLWQLDGGEFQLLDAGGTFTATENGVYRILLVNQPDAGQPGPAVHYSLDLAIDYSAADTTPNHESAYTVSDGHGGSDSAAVNISYQEGCTLLGTTGDDVLLAGAGDDSLHGGDGNDVLSGGAGNNYLYGDNGNDILFSEAGNEVLDGGAGNNTASYALAESGVTVSTAQLGPQNTGGAGTDTLINIQNLIGSDYDDHLSGDYEANIINGGAGNDVLTGGLGNDTLTGGAGHDTFKWLSGDSGHDVVTDFSLGADTLDLSKLLQGFSAGADSLDDFLHFKVTDSGADLVSSIEIGSGGASQTIDLAGVDLAHHYGVGVGAGGMVSGADAGSIISGMLGDHSLRADVV